MMQADDRLLIPAIADHYWEISLQISDPGSFLGRKFSELSDSQP